MIRGEWDMDEVLAVNCFSCWYATTYAYPPTLKRRNEGGGNGFFDYQQLVAK